MTQWYLSCRCFRQTMPVFFFVVNFQIIIGFDKAKCEPDWSSDVFTMFY